VVQSTGIVRGGHVCCCCAARIDVLLRLSLLLCFFTCQPSAADDAKKGACVGRLLLPARAQATTTGAWRRSWEARSTHARPCYRGGAPVPVAGRGAGRLTLSGKGTAVGGGGRGGGSRALLSAAKARPVATEGGKTGLPASRQRKRHGWWRWREGRLVDRPASSSKGTTGGGGARGGGSTGLPPGTEAPPVAADGGAAGRPPCLRR